jgi:nucleotide-binding universal stress UspA family protein
VSDVISAVIREDQPAEQAGQPILVACTNSERGRRALAAAARLASAGQRKLFAYQVLTRAEFKADAEESLKELASEVRAVAGTEGGGCVAEVAAYRGHYDDDEFGRAVCLVDAATERQADLIVSGTQNRSGGSKPVSGTMTQRLLQHLPCPLLIAANEPPRPYRQVLVAIDFSAVSFALVKAAAELAPHADIHLIHVTDGPEGHGREETADLEKLIETVAKGATSDGNGGSVPRRFVPKVIVGSPGKAISDAVDALKPDLLVLGTKGRTGLARMLLGSVAARFVDEPPCDLLVLRSPR